MLFCTIQLNATISALFLTRTTQHTTRYAMLTDEGTRGVIQTITYFILSFFAANIVDTLIPHLFAHAQSFFSNTLQDTADKKSRVDSENVDTSIKRIISKRHSRSSKIMPVVAAVQAGKSDEGVSIDHVTVIAPKASAEKRRPPFRAWAASSKQEIAVNRAAGNKPLKAQVLGPRRRGLAHATPSRDDVQTTAPASGADLSMLTKLMKLNPLVNNVVSNAVRQRDFQKHLRKAEYDEYMSLKTLRLWILRCAYAVVFMFTAGCVFLNLVFGLALDDDEIARWLFFLLGGMAFDFLLFQPLKIFAVWIATDKMVIPLFSLAFVCSIAWMTSCIAVINDGDSHTQQFLCYLSLVH